MCFFSFSLLPLMLHHQILIKVGSVPSTSEKLSRGLQSDECKSTWHNQAVQRGRASRILPSDRDAQALTRPPCRGCPLRHCPSVSVLTARNGNKRGDMPAAFSLLIQFHGLFVFTSQVYLGTQPKDHLILSTSLFNT